MKRKNNENNWKIRVNWDNLNFVFMLNVTKVLANISPWTSSCKLAATWSDLTFVELNHKTSNTTTPYMGNYRCWQQECSPKNFSYFRNRKQQDPRHKHKNSHHLHQVKNCKSHKENHIWRTNSRVRTVFFISLEMWLNKAEVPAGNNIKTCLAAQTDLLGTPRERTQTNHQREE